MSRRIGSVLAFPIIVSLLAVMSLAAGAAASAAEPQGSKAKRRPNVLVIFSDDHGWADLGAQGVDADVRTPHLDQLARDGVRFTRGYVTAPQCTPSRAGLMTGRYQNRCGVEHNGIPLQPDVVTLPERLRDAGYLTGMSGKWHLDMEDRREGSGGKNVLLPACSPHAQGFAEYFDGIRRDYSASHALDGTAFADPPHLVRDVRCRVVVQTEAALSFLRRRAAEPDRPWFHYLAYMAPHVPLESPEPWFRSGGRRLRSSRRSTTAWAGSDRRSATWARKTTPSSSSSATTARRWAGNPGMAPAICRSTARRACSPRGASACRSSPPGRARSPRVRSSTSR
jgi:arylsulfatase A-like enzyme